MGCIGLMPAGDGVPWLLGGNSTGIVMRGLSPPK